VESSRDWEEHAYLLLISYRIHWCHAVLIASSEILAGGASGYVESFDIIESRLIAYQVDRCKPVHRFKKEWTVPLSLSSS